MRNGLNSAYTLSEDENLLIAEDGLAQSRKFSTAGGMAGQISLGQFTTPSLQWGVSQMFVPSRVSMIRLFLRYQKGIL